MGKFILEDVTGESSDSTGGNISKNTSSIGTTSAALPALSKASIKTVYRPPSANSEVIFKSKSVCTPLVNSSPVNFTLWGELTSIVPLVCLKITLALAKFSLVRYVITVDLICSELIGRLIDISGTSSS